MKTFTAAILIYISGVFAVFFYIFFGEAYVLAQLILGILLAIYIRRKEVLRYR
jgi:hypothetical protein